MNMDYRVKQLVRGKLVPAVLSIVLGIVIIFARRATFYCRAKLGNKKCAIARKSRILYYNGALI